MPSFTLLCDFQERHTNVKRGPAVTNSTMPWSSTLQLRKGATQPLTVKNNWHLTKYYTSNRTWRAPANKSINLRVP